MTAGSARATTTSARSVTGTVNEEKLGGTLGELIERINATGVKFGIWVEPEMVNENSGLFRAHPDWGARHPR